MTTRELIEVLLGYEELRDRPNNTLVMLSLGEMREIINKLFALVEREEDGP
jgi:hypothetical protein